MIYDIRLFRLFNLITYTVHRIFYIGSKVMLAAGLSPTSTAQACVT